jgi:peptidoglycan/LPS O-acetylase OafA/YrhL
LSLYLACLFFGANLCPLFGIAVPDPASVFWSLAVEEHFYAVWPIAVRRLGKWLPVLAGGIFILEPILRYVYAQRAMLTYQYSWVRFDGLSIGALLAIYLASGRRSASFSKTLVWSGVLLFICGCLFLVVVGGTKEPSQFATLRPSVAQIGFAAVMLAVLEFPGGWSAILGSSFLRVTADLSYCLYLIHMSVIALYDRVFGYDGFPSLLVRAGIVLLVCYAIAWLSFKYFESPLRARGKVKGEPLALVGPHP